MRNQGLRWLGLFLVLIWGLPILACSGGAQATATPTKASVVDVQETQETTATLTPEPTAGPSPEVLRYVSEVEGPVDQITKSLTRLSELFQSPRVGVDDWTYAVAAELVLVRLSHETLTEVDAPAEMTGVHTALIAGTSLCYEATELIISALDNRDADEMGRASVMITECGSGFRAALEQANVYMSSIGGQQTNQQTNQQTRIFVVTVNSDANLREGPGTEFVAVASANAGTALEVTGRNEAGDWLQLRGGEWIAAFLVDGVPEELPVAGQ